MRILQLLGLSIFVVACSSLHQRKLENNLSRKKNIDFKLSVPFYRQKDNYCGPNSLYSIVSYYEPHQFTSENIEDMTFTPGSKGTYKRDMLSAARRLGYAAYEIEPEEYIASLQAKVPILVFQNLGLSWSPTWHYSILTGFSGDQETFYHHNGYEKHQPLTPRKLINTWERGGAWSYVIVFPDYLPNFVSVKQAMANIKIFIRLNNEQAAIDILKQAVQRWPASSEIHAVLAIIYEKRKNYRQALVHQKKVVSLLPHSQKAKFNLAYLYKKIQNK